MLMLCLQRYDFPAKLLFIWLSFSQEICLYLHSFVVLPFLVSQGSRRSSSGSQSPPSSSAHQGILEEEDEGDSDSIKQVGPRYIKAYEAEVVNEMLQISTFLQQDSPAHILASLLVPPVNPEMEVIEPVKILSIKVAKPKTSFLQR